MEKNNLNKEKIINKWENSGFLGGLVPMDENSPIINLIAPDNLQPITKEKQSMEWQVRIEGKLKQRIMVKFDPLKEIIIFTGQYSIKNKWIDFSEEDFSMNITLEVIQELLFKVYEKMNERIKVHEDLNKSFNLIKLIEIKGE
jgi:hypothetical protein